MFPDLNAFSWLLRELFTATVSPQLTRHITPLLEEKELLLFPPFPILLFCLSFSRLRLFIQELKVKVYLPRSHRVSMALSIHPILPSITLPLYHLPSPPASAGEGGEKFMILVMFRGKAGNRVAQNSQSAYQCA